MPFSGLHTWSYGRTRLPVWWKNILLSDNGEKLSQNNGLVSPVITYFLICWDTTHIISLIMTCINFFWHTGRNKLPYVRVGVILQPHSLHVPTDYQLISLISALLTTLSLYHHYMCHHLPVHCSSDCSWGNHTRESGLFFIWIRTPPLHFYSGIVWAGSGGPEPRPTTVLRGLCCLSCARWRC